jgi:hypothetical protein
MKAYILLTIIFLSTKSFCQKGIDAKFGYKDIHFNMNADSLFKFIKAIKGKASDNEFSTYTVIDPKYLKAGDCNFSSVTVMAFNNRVDFIILKTKPSEFHILKALLFQMFGSGFKSNPYIERYAWLGKKASGILEEELDNSATFSMQSKAGGNAYRSYMKTHAKKGASDF